MIDIKAFASEKAANKAQLEKIKKAYYKDVSVQVLGNRVLLLPIAEEEKKETTSGGIFLSEESQQQLKDSSLMRAIVKSIGSEVKNVVSGDIVYVYPNQFEATMAFDGVGYLVYQERSLIATDIPTIKKSSIVS